MLKSTSEHPDLGNRKRLLWLDGARGFAAIAVMIYHYDVVLHVRPFFESAYLAVDLFFIMSGFVLSQSYERAIASNRISFRNYLKIRLLRLYPTYLSATIFGFAYYLIRYGLHPEHGISRISLFYILTSNLAFIPVFVAGLNPPGIFPFSPSGWSLSTEFIVSIAYGAVLARISTKAIMILVSIFGCMFFYFAFKSNSFDLGWSISNFFSGILRTFFDFTLGMLLYRAAPLVPVRILNPALMFATIFIILAMWQDGGLLSQVICVLLVFPAFILSSQNYLTEGRVSAAFHQAGRISYSIYLFHTPVFLWSAGIYKILTKHDPIMSDARWLGWMIAALTILISYIFTRWGDEPVRSFLEKRMRNSL